MDFIVDITLLSGLLFDNPNSREKRENKILRESECVTQTYMIIKPEKYFSVDMKTLYYSRYYTKICEAIRYCERQIIREIFVFCGKAEHQIFMRLLQNIFNSRFRWKNKRLYGTKACQL